MPNKLFDYIHNKIPILASPLPEIKNIVQTYKLGCIIEKHEEKHIADKINEMIENKNQFLIWQENAKIASKELFWEKEEKKLLRYFK